MKIYDIIKAELEKNPEARERRWRDRTLIKLVLEKNNKDGIMFVDVSFLGDFVKDYMSYERIWRQVLQDEPSLRGEDYCDGKILSQNYQIKELGKEVGYPN